MSAVRPLVSSREGGCCGAATMPGPSDCAVDGNASASADAHSKAERERGRLAGSVMKDSRWASQKAGREVDVRLYPALQQTSATNTHAGTAGGRDNATGHRAARDRKTHRTADRVRPATALAGSRGHRETRRGQDDPRARAAQQVLTV